MLYELGLLLTCAVCLWVLVDLVEARGPFWRRAPFMFLLGGCGIWALGQLVSQEAETQAQILLSNRLVHFGVNTVAVTWLWTGAVTARARWFRRRPWLVPVLATPLAFVYSFLFFDPYGGRYLDGGSSPPAHGPLFWFQAIYDWILVAVGTGHVLVAAVRLGKGRPIRLATILLAAGVPLVANFLYVTFGSPPDPTPILLSFSGVALRLAVLDSGLASLLPMSQRGVFDQLRTGVVVADLAGVVIDANPAAIGFFGGRRLMGRRLADLIERARDDPTRDLEVEEVPLQSRLGKVGSVALFTDRTEAVGLERQLRESQRLESLGILAGGAAHDFNNLLGAIIGHASLARGPARDEAARHLDAAIQTAKQASHLTGQLLAYAGKGTFQVRPVNLSLEIQELQGLLRSSLPKHIGLELHLDPAIPTVPADPVEVSQVLLNLTRNGADAIEKGGKVVVSTRARELDEHDLRRLVPGHRARVGPHVLLEVTDEGCGMDEETRRRVFEPFFTTKEEGHGLGLAATLGIVHGHGGGIEVDSEPGKGTRFRVYLPVAG